MKQINKVMTFFILALTMVISVHAGTLSVVEFWNVPNAIQPEGGIVGEGYIPGNYTMTVSEYTNPNLQTSYIQDVYNITVNESGGFHQRLWGSRPQIFGGYRVDFNGDSINYGGFGAAGHAMQDCHIADAVYDYYNDSQSYYTEDYRADCPNVQSVPEFTPIAIIVAITGVTVGLFIINKKK